MVTYQEDITTPACANAISKTLKTWKADVVLNDGAPNVGQAWVQDAYTQSCLVLAALSLAVKFLNKNGTFVTKLFRSKDYNKVMWVLNQLFDKVEATKPPSSRAVSAEIFIVCRGYKDPKKLDHRLLDPKYVFKELEDSEDPNASLSKAKNALNVILFPEKAAKKRKREGYDEGDYILFKNASIVDFVACDREADAITMLASLHELTFRKSESEESNDRVPLDRIRKHPLTTGEIVECCKDLKVLGRKDYKNLLKWRKDLRSRLELKPAQRADKESESEIEEAEELVDGGQQQQSDQEEDPLTELDALEAKKVSELKKKRKKRLEKLAKDRRRMQLNMTTPTDIGMEGGDTAALLDDDIAVDLDGETQIGKKSLFDLREIPTHVPELVEGNMEEVYMSSEFEDEDFDNDEPEVLSDIDDDLDRQLALEDQMDTLYEEYLSKQLAKDPKMKVRQMRARETPFEGADEETAALSGEESSSDSEAEQEAPEETADEIARRKKARLFFNQDIFNDEALAAAPSESDDEQKFDGDAEMDEKEVEVIQEESAEESDGDAFGSDNDEDEAQAVARAERFQKTNNILSTAEAITIAMKMVQDGGRNRESILDDVGYNRHVFNDQTGLPTWFLDDEAKYSRPNRPITKEAVQLLRERQKQLDARPIKKVLEAKARKKGKAIRKLDKLKKKLNTVLDEDGPDDPEMGTKLSEMQRTMKTAIRKAKESTRRKVEVVVAKGGNKGRQGRPKGVKGRYKMVDGRMKKEVRAQKRVEKAKHGKKRK